jgi:hypothetical protein
MLLHYKYLCLLSSLALVCNVARAQSVSIGVNGDAPSLLARYLNWLNEPYAYLDSNYVAQQCSRWIVSCTGSVLQSGVKLSDRVHSYVEGDLAKYSVTDIRLQERVYNDISLTLTYRGLSIGWGVEMGRSSEKNQSFSFCWIKPYYGISARYTDLHEFAKADGYYESYVDDEVWSGDFGETSEYTANLRECQVDGYYAFNVHKFAYSSVYGGGVYQRRSAGSWMVGLKYMYGRIKFDSREAAFLNYVGGISKVKTHQLSIGGGYSYNFVAFHKDGEGEQQHGLRNLTFNLTLMPMLTVLNPLIFSYESEMQQELFGLEGSRTRHTRPQLNYTAMTGMVFSTGRYSIKAQCHYDNFRFNTGTHTEPFDLFGMDAKDVNHMKGRFFHWGVSMELNVRF